MFSTFKTFIDNYLLAVQIFGYSLSNFLKYCGFNTNTS